jgi:hypothetical protein
VSAASAGIGLRLNHSAGVWGNFGIAWPLTREIDTPIYGDEKDPRFMMQIGYDF